MPKILTIVVIISLLGIGGWMLLIQNLGDIRPAILPPPKEEISKILESPAVGESPDLPFKLPDGFKIGVFAQGLGNARDLEFSPGGTLLLSIPEPGKVVALPDKDKNGVADEAREVVGGLDRPHGIAFYNNKLFIAEETRVVRYAWNEEKLAATQEKVLFTLPKGGRHFTRTIAFSNPPAPSGLSSGSKTGGGQMFISIGSTCDVCFEKGDWLAAVIVSDSDGTSPRLWAKGLRNSVFITTNPETDELWGTEMGRDFLGDNLPPDEINIIRDGQNYGWPICYGDKIHDANFDPSTRSARSGQVCRDTEAPVYEIPAHSAPLGLTFINSSQFPKEWQGDLLVSYHGSWNRSTPIGYKVVRLDVDGNTVKRETDFISGFLHGSQALGRPVDLVFDKQGSLYISDDKAGVVYKVISQ